MKETHEFEVPAADVDQAGKDVRFTVRAAWVRGVFEGHEATTSGKDGSFEARLSKSGTDVVVRGRIRSELTMPCSRCLGPVTVPIDQQVSALLVLGSKVKTPEGEYEFSAEEADVFPYDGETIVLDDLAKDELFLEIPMNPLCSEQCPGMNPPPDVETGNGTENIDPRLLPLLRFKAKT